MYKAYFQISLTWHFIPNNRILFLIVFNRHHASAAKIQFDDITRINPRNMHGGTALVRRQVGASCLLACAARRCRWVK